MKSPDQLRIQPAKEHSMAKTIPLDPKQLDRYALTCPRFPVSDAPIRISSWKAPFKAERDAIVDRVGACGFALVESDRVPESADVIQLGSAIDLGAVYTPPTHRTDPLTEAGVTRVTNSSADHQAHQPAFPLHVDGTLQRIGEVKTTILLCERSGARGGSSILFNAADAFLALARHDPSAARAIARPGILTRRSMHPEFYGQSTADYAFALTGDRIITRYSTTPNDVYQALSVADEPALARALTFLKDCARLDSPFYRELTLRAYQGIVFSNDQISHGRTAYTDDMSGIPRLLFRGLFRRHPSSGRTVRP